MLADKKSELIKSLEDAGLLYEVKSYGKREIIVHEATGHTSREIGRMTMEIEQNKALPDDSKSGLMSVYVPVMACSMGDLPETPEQFYMMKDLDIEDWTRTARKINPHIFGLLDLHEKHLNSILDRMSKKKSQMNLNATDSVKMNTRKRNKKPLASTPS